MKNQKLYHIALVLAIVTIVYNFVEGIFATYLGYENESLALFGFGSDSFIEVISGLGIVHMVWRIRKHPDSDRDRFEKTALRITGVAFYILFFSLVMTGLYNLWTGNKPTTTFWGVIISSISIIVMWILVIWKRKVGNQLNSAPILADANCTLVCIYMSLILLASSGIYTLFDIAYIDNLGALGLAYFALKEGKECFEKANKDHTDCAC